MRGGSLIVSYNFLPDTTEINTDKDPRESSGSFLKYYKDFKIMENNIQIEKHDTIKDVWTITINNPGKKNALTPDIMDQMSDFLGNKKIRKTARVIVIRGKGEDAFSAGYDISKIEGQVTSGQSEVSSAVLYRGLNSIKSFPSPVISMINGFCIGAGLHLAISADIRVAAENSKIGITPVKLGLLYHPDGILDFYNLIGPGNTKELFFTGSLYSALEAKEMGLINRIVPLSDLKETVYSIAKEISHNAPLAIQGTKYCVNKFSESTCRNSEIMDECIQLREKIFTSQDIKEGKQAFVEKRKPVFKGE